MIYTGAFLAALTAMMVSAGGSETNSIDQINDILYPLAAGGQAGVERALGLLRDELQRTMALLGCDSVAKLGGDYVRKAR